MTKQEPLEKVPGGGGSGSGKGNPVRAPAATGSKKDYRGFVAGVFSGIAKLSG